MEFTKAQIIGIAQEAIQQEASAISHLGTFLSDQFTEIIDICHQCKGRIVITGIGKSAIIAQKLTATLNSTGSPALYMHAADAIHGDLGMIQPGDVVWCISKSGNSPEIKVLIPLIKNMGNTVIALVGNTESYLARESDYMVNTTVDRESCPNNLAPTTSTTAQMVMGDTIAVCLMRLKNFDKADFARYHPGGALGKKLYLKVGDLLQNSQAPQVQPSSTLREVILEISSKRLGATAVVENGDLVGLITDGDLRRMMEKDLDLNRVTASDIMTRQPTQTQPAELAFSAFTTMENKKITQLPVVENGKYIGLIHLHDILKEGIF
ncbi:MAG TPA: KpsF/GutQ family sugar-phosphate isomerase [Luteibaculaceae bacterium]|nr:KpsF/GutQ family sugar-phosphate isomerase [Luteibaculaceae bacterium]